MMYKDQITIEKIDASDQLRLERLRAERPIVTENDIFEHCLDELFEIENPSLKPDSPGFAEEREKFFATWVDKGSFDQQGVWVYYPWSQSLVHFPSEEVYIKLRTSRNRNLITTEEQAIFQSKTVGIAGMSVGSNILNTLVLIGGPRHIKISDMDVISVPNLNRLMAPAQAVNLNKAVYFARRSLEVDPFLTIDVYPNGLNPEDFTDWFQEPKLDLYIEEMDNPYLKIESRKEARRLGIPVIMAADNGDGALIDVERFDIEPDRPLFHGRLEKYDLGNITPNMPFPMKLAIIADIVHLDEATPRAQDSLGQVGTVLNTWPQLGTAALIAGVTMSFVGRRILLGESMPSGRYSLELEDSLVPETQTNEYREWRKLHTKQVMESFEAFKAQFVVTN